MALTLGAAANTRSQMTVNFDSLHTFANEYVLPILYDNFYKKQRFIKLLREKDAFTPWSQSIVDRVPVMTGGNDQVQAYDKAMQLTAAAAETSTSALYELTFYRNAIKFYEGDIERTDSANSVISKFKSDMVATLGSLSDKLYRDMLYGAPVAAVTGPPAVAAHFRQNSYTDGTNTVKGVVPMSVWSRKNQSTAPITDGVGAIGHIDPANVANWRFNTAVANSTSTSDANDLFARDITTYKKLISAINDMVTEICYHGVDEQDCVIVCDPITYNIIKTNEADKIRYTSESEQTMYALPFSVLMFNGRIPMIYDHEIPDLANSVSGRTGVANADGGTVMVLTPGKSFKYAERVNRSQYFDSGTFTDQVIDQARAILGASALEKYPYMPFYVRPFQSPDNERQSFTSEITYGIGLHMYKPRANGVIYGIKRAI